MEVPFVAKQATAEKRQRRERGSINPDDIIKGAFELAEEVGIDNLSMPLLGKHLGVGVTSIYWYFRKKDDLLNAMTDRALRQYVFATPYVEAKDWRETLRNHARTMRKTFMGNPILCDLILIRSALSPRAAKLGVQEVEKAIASLVEAGLSADDAFDTYSAMSVHVRGSVVLQRLRDKNRAADEGPSDIEETLAIDAESTPLLAQVTAKGHHIGAADENNFEFGLECILDHASRLIDEGGKRPAKAARKATKASGPRTRSKAPARSFFARAGPTSPELDLDDDRAALATTRAHCRDADSSAAPLQLVDQRRHHARAGRGNGVAEAATTSGEIDQVFVQPVLAAGRDRHRCECLVDLPQRDVRRLQPRAVEHLADDLHRAQPGVTRRHSCGGPGLHGREDRQLLGVGVVTLDQCHGRGGIIGAAAVACGD
jgi:AcrR family transcriptional regulator